LDLGEKRVIEEAEMDMTPMVDVTFQLLIFFMVTAAFAMQKSIEIPKPEQDQPSTQVQQKDPETDPEYIVVVVDEFNTYQVLADGIDPDDAEAPSEQELLRKLRLRARRGAGRRDPDQAVGQGQWRGASREGRRRLGCRHRGRDGAGPTDDSRGRGVLMSADRFLKQLEQAGLLDESVLAKLRKQIAASKTPPRRARWPKPWSRAVT
jgi:biopolymer transport protein ExbD